MEDSLIQDATRLWLTGRMDQLGAEMKDQGKIVGQYYKSLLDSGMPEPLCRELVHQWHAMYWLNQIFPEACPNLDVDVGL
jgi:hypothetical protein